LLLSLRRLVISGPAFQPAENTAGEGPDGRSLSGPAPAARDSADSRAKRRASGAGAGAGVCIGSNPLCCLAQEKQSNLSFSICCWLCPLAG
jgi:hypothetical protein